MKKRLLFIFIVLFISASTFAQTPEITNGLAYLTSTQNSDGSWGGTDTSINTPLYSTAVSAETLNILNETSSQTYINAVQWLGDFPVENSGYIAWKILALSEENIDLTPDINLLLQWQNNDGGWGGQSDYLSSIFHTALTIQALKAINHPDLNTISSALFYLTSNQNPDGGWGFSSDPSTGSGSSVYMTALVSMTLQQFYLTPETATAINKASASLCFS